VAVKTGQNNNINNNNKNVVVRSANYNYFFLLFIVINIIILTCFDCHFSAFFSVNDSRRPYISYSVPCTLA